MVRKALLGQLSDLDIRLLRVFRSVVECGGMAAAELELNIGRSTISRHVKDLETRLGLTLCHRGRGGFSLTAEGQEIYAATLRLVAALDDFRAGVDDLHQRLTGTLTLALFDKTVTNDQAQLHAALRLFTDLTPAVAVEIHVQALNTIERGILDGQYQVGIVPVHRASTALDYLALFTERMDLYCAPDHPLFGRPGHDGDDDAIRRQNYAGLGYHSPNMEISHAMRLRRRATVNDQEAVATLVRSGRYVGFLPDHYARQFVDQGQMRRLANPRFRYSVQFAAIVRHAPKPSRLVQTFLDCLRQAHGLATLDSPA
jgi:DNA-binding transcriptional LysR family regulator